MKILKSHFWAVALVLLLNSSHGFAFCENALEIEEDEKTILSILTSAASFELYKEYLTAFLNCKDHQSTDWNTSQLQEIQKSLGNWVDRYPNLQPDLTRLMALNLKAGEHSQFISGLRDLSIINPLSRGHKVTGKRSRSELDQEFQVSQNYDTQLAEPLFNQGLMPNGTRVIRIENALFDLGRVFKVESGKFAVFFKVIVKDMAPQLRAAYASDSQGVFRLLTTINRMQNAPQLKSYFPRYDKGKSEHHLVLPFLLQVLLSHDLIKSLSTLASVNEASFENMIPKVDDYMEAHSRRAKLRKYRQTDKGFTVLKDTNEGDKLFRERGGKVRRPEEIELKSVGLEPDYDHPSLGFNSYSQLLGDLRMRVCPSKDGILDYLIVQDRKSMRGWIGGVYLRDSELTPLGVHYNPVEPEEMGAPLLEYDKQIPQIYKGRFHPERREYRSQSEFLRRTPVLGPLFRTIHKDIKPLQSAQIQQGF